jgi:hypothetical protein
MVVKLIGTREPAKKIAIEAQRELKRISPAKSATL